MHSVLCFGTIWQHKRKCDTEYEMIRHELDVNTDMDWVTQAGTGQNLNVTHLFPDGLSGRQLRFDSDEQRDKRSLAQTPQSIITAIFAVAPLLTVPEQHCWRIHLERSINLPSGIIKKKTHQWAVQAVSVPILLMNVSSSTHKKSVSPWTENKWCWKESWQSPASASQPRCVPTSLCPCRSEEQKAFSYEANDDSSERRRTAFLLTTPVS